VSRKTVSIAVLGSTSRGRDLARSAAPEDWVRENFGGADPMSVSRLESFEVDLAAERRLFEVLVLGAFLPFALGWFWLMNAMAGRARI